MDEPEVMLAKMFPPRVIRRDPLGYMPEGTQLAMNERILDADYVVSEVVKLLDFLRQRAHVNSAVVLLEQHKQSPTTPRIR